MADAMLEHVNITVSDPERTAENLCTLFDWRIRWQGDAIHSGKSIHVGPKDNYIVLYRQDDEQKDLPNSYVTRGGLNHVGVVVDDLDDVERRVRRLGFEPHSHADYEPGRRFYFHDHDGIEFEVVSYRPAG